MTTGERIKELRISKHLSQEELGAMIGVKKAAINKYETGVVVNLKRSTIAKLADALDVSPIYLLGWDENNPPAQVDEGIWKKICADSAKLKLVTWIAGLDQDTFRRMEKILDAAFDV